MCREANRAYARRYRSQLRPVPDAALEMSTNVDTGQAEEPTAPTGVVVEAVQTQIDRMGAAESRPGLAAIAVRLAELLDNPLALPQHPAAAGRLIELLGKLAQDQRRGGRLAAVREMTNDRR